MFVRLLTQSLSLFQSIDILDDPIVKNYGDSTGLDELDSKKDEDPANEPEPMELDDEEENATNTIIEVNSTKPSEPAATADEQLLHMAKLQLDYLKQMEKEQEKLVVAGQRDSPK